MPDDVYLEDLFKTPALRPEMFMEPPEEKNRYFPEGEGLLWQGLGLLDLVVGAPARAVQGTIITAALGDNVLEGAAKSFIGLSLDTGEFGRGEIASGSEMLEELGVIQDKENIGNIIAGIGTDVASDLIMFNFIGAGKRALLGGPGKLTKLARVGSGIKYRGWFKPRDAKRFSDEGTRLLKRRILMSIDPGNTTLIDDLARQFEETYSAQHTLGMKSIREMLPKGYKDIMALMPEGKHERTIFGYLRAKPIIKMAAERFPSACSSR